VIGVVTVITRLEGGAGTVALRGVLGLDRGAYEQVIVTGSGGGLLEQAAAHGVEVVVNPVLKPSIDPLSDLRAVRWLASVLADRRPDVVHTHCAKAGTIGRLAARRAGTRRIVHTYHGFPFHEFQSAARRRAYVEVERRLGKFTDIGLCVGTGVAVEAIRRGLISPERVRTIGVPVDIQGGGQGRPGPGLGDLGQDGTAQDSGVWAGRHPGDVARARRRLGIPDGDLIVGAVGRLTYQKAPEDFVAAIRRLGRRDVIGVWVGGGERAAATARLARAAGQRLVLCGDRSDVADLLPAFDVFALPSRYEGLPIAVAEAMASGVPVVATAVNAVADLVEPGVTGLLVPPGRPDLMATAVGYLLNSPAEAARMARAARSRIGARYGVSALRSALEAAYCPGADLGRYDSCEPGFDGLIDAT
jgi:glycosyltransferase involved in cell wall biosynthesis